MKSWLLELWKYRELVPLFVERDIQARYKQTFLGIFWAILQPLLMMGVLTLIFSNFLKVDSAGIPYPIFSYTALVPWTFIARTVTASSVSLLTYKSLITKVYFPREIVPLSVVLSSLVDFFLASLVFVGMMILYQVPVTISVLYVLILLPIQILFAGGIALFLSSLGILFRDIQFALPFMVQVWMYGTPVIYGLQGISSKYLPLFYLNPAAGIIEGYRRTVLFGEAPNWELLGVSVLFSFLFLGFSYWFFKRMELFIVDVM